MPITVWTSQIQVPPRKTRTTSHSLFNTKASNVQEISVYQLLSVFTTLAVRVLKRMIVMRFLVLVFQ
jgi:hypothetical protein